MGNIIIIKASSACHPEHSEGYVPPVLRSFAMVRMTLLQKLLLFSMDAAPSITFE
jgi:hypothetical protein